MQASFSIIADPATSTVRIAMSGFFLEPEIDRFVAARDAAHRTLRCAANGHRTLVDIRRMRIQTQASVEAFARVLHDAAHISRQLAFVVAPGLARAQIRRAAVGRNARFFPSPEEAEAWLREDDDPRCFPSGSPATEMHHVHH